MNLADTKKLFVATMPRFGNHLCDYVHSSDPDLKADALEKILDKIYDQLTSNRRYYQKDGEDKLTINIVEKLQALSIDASHDKDVSGHCDIVVESSDGEFRWLAEAKLHSTYGWLLSGFKQLTTRYGVASKGKNRGEIIIYCRNQKALDIFVKWIEYLLENRNEVSMNPEGSDNPLRARTIHDCTTSGLSFKIRHSIIPLSFDPEK